MAKSEEWKRRRAAVIGLCMEYAKKRFGQEDIHVVEETDTYLVVRCHCNNVRYSPFTGGFTGDVRTEVAEDLKT